MNYIYVYSISIGERTIIMDVANLHINSKNKKFKCLCSERNCNIRLYEVPYQYEAFCFSNALMHIIEASKLFSYTVLHMCQTLFHLLRVI